MARRHGKYNKIYFLVFLTFFVELCSKGDAGNPVTNLVNGIPYLQGIVTFTDEDECVETEANTVCKYFFECYSFSAKAYTVAWSKRLWHQTHPYKPG